MSSYWPKQNQTKSFFWPRFAIRLYFLLPIREVVASHVTRLSTPAQCTWQAPSPPVPQSTHCMTFWKTSPWRLTRENFNCNVFLRKNGSIRIKYSGLELWSYDSLRDCCPQDLNFQYPLPGPYNYLYLHQGDIRMSYRAAARMHIKPFGYLTQSPYFRAYHTPPLQKYCWDANPQKATILIMPSNSNVSWVCLHVCHLC
jgi:hypothetical protein